MAEKTASATGQALTAAKTEREAADVVHVMSSDAGRRYVWKILSMAGLYRTSYVPQSDVTVFNEGARNLGIKLHAELQRTCPAQCLEMQKEAQARAAHERRDIEDLKHDHASTE